MSTRLISVLLVGEALENFPQLLRWLDGRECRCQFAQSYRDACNLVSCTQFDLVLSQYQLPDRTAFPLLDRLVGFSHDSVFLRTGRTRPPRVEGLERGQRCIAKPVFPSDALTGALARVLHAVPESCEKEAVTSEGGLTFSHGNVVLLCNVQVRKGRLRAGLSGQVLRIN